MRFQTPDKPSSTSGTANFDELYEYVMRESIDKDVALKGMTFILGDPGLANWFLAQSTIDFDKGKVSTNKLLQCYIDLYLGESSK